VTPLRPALVLALVLGLSGVGEVSAAPPPPPAPATVTPGTAVLRANKGTTLRVRIDDRRTVRRISATKRVGDGTAEDSTPTRIDEDSWSADLVFDRHDPPGPYDVYVDYYDASHGYWVSGRTTGAFLVKRDTTLEFDAAPEDVPRGGTLTLSGVLSRLTASSSGSDYVGHGSKTLTVQYAPSGGSFWDHSTVTTDDDGRFRKRVTAEGDGTWRVHFAGTSRYDASTSRRDAIHVR